MLPLKTGTAEPSKVGAPIVPQAKNGWSFIKFSVLDLFIILQEKLILLGT